MFLSLYSCIVLVYLLMLARSTRPYVPSLYLWLDKPTTASVHIAKMCATGRCGDRGTGLVRET